MALLTSLARLPNSREQRVSCRQASGPARGLATECPCPCFSVLRMSEPQGSPPDPMPQLLWKKARNSFVACKHRDDRGFARLCVGTLVEASGCQKRSGPFLGPCRDCCPEACTEQVMMRQVLELPPKPWTGRHSEKPHLGQLLHLSDSTFAMPAKAVTGWLW